MTLHKSLYFSTLYTSKCSKLCLKLVYILDIFCNLFPMADDYYDFIYFLKIDLMSYLTNKMSTKQPQIDLFNMKTSDF